MSNRTEEIRSFELLNRAPKCGYDLIGNPNKAESRDRFWKTCKRLLRCKNPKIVFMPEKETALEVPLAESLGFCQENLIAVNESAGIVAKWRKAYPNLFDTCGDEIGRTFAFGKLAKSGVKIDAVNLDLCGNFSDETEATLIDVAHSDPPKDRILISITLLKGRESSQKLTSQDISGTEKGGRQGVIEALAFAASRTWNAAGIFPEGKNGDRMAAAFSIFAGAGFRVTPLYCGTYQSTSPMIYGAAICERGKA